MALLPVEDALALLLRDAEPVGPESVPLAEATDRVLSEPLSALRTQPPFAASAMDGYAVGAADLAAIPARLTVIGSAPAGRRHAGTVGSGEAVRIFTGAPVPDGADTVVIQENVRALDDGTVEILQAAVLGQNIRKAGLDFVEGDPLLDSGRVLDAAALSLAAAANHPRLTVLRRPLVAIIATGDELLPPGSQAGPDQIIASNSFGVASVARSAGADVLDLGIAPDRKNAISALIRRALDAGADVVVTLGGASVGDHDFIHDILTDEGVTLDVWKIAMRPGKPLMFGRRGKTRFIGLPGNPVASLVCSHVFLRPLLARLGGRDHQADLRDAVLGKAMPANDLRQDYVRAIVENKADRLVATPFSVQDSSMLKILADANALIVRDRFAPAADAGTACHVLMLR